MISRRCTRLAVTMAVLCALAVAFVPVSAANDWHAEYFSNPTLSGNPALVCTEAGLHFEWGNGSPVAGVSADNFSATFERTIDDLPAGRYTFTTTSDDGVRLYVNDKLIINAWYPMRGTRTAAVDLPGGSIVIRLEYFERYGAANVPLTWKTP